MGHEYSSSVIIGFAMDQDEFLMPFKTKTEEKFHMEDRFDQRNGKKLEPVKVVDEESVECYLVEGQTYEEAWEALDAIAASVGCNVSSHGNMCTGEDFMIGIEPKYVSENDKILLTEIPTLLKDCKRIKAVFAKKFGIQLGEPVITSLGSYG